MRRATLMLTAVALLLAGCGGGGKGRASTATGARTAPAPAPDLTVAAAASLKTALTAYAGSVTYAKPRFSFAGSDALAAQIRAGVRPDVFAAANAALPESLHADGLVGVPVPFATNRLVVAVPAGGRGRVRALSDLAVPKVKIAIGSPSVPIGAYTRTVLSRMPAESRAAVMANVRSEEPDVSGIVGKIAAGAVDAGFVYASDVRASGGKLKAIALGPELQPEVVYEAAVVDGAKHAAEARRFVAGLRTGAGAQALRRAGFLPAP